MKSFLVSILFTIDDHIIIWKTRINCIGCFRWTSGITTLAHSNALPFNLADRRSATLRFFTSVSLVKPPIAHVSNEDPTFETLSSHCHRHPLSRPSSTFYYDKKPQPSPHSLCPYTYILKTNHTTIFRCLSLSLSEMAATHDSWK
ncbi:unnamed protein product [Lactuca virosa]|uniref:Uncharacterized protein n=1 Tax=Lactuca virosa TaxID=75947 RepID=A0AAU9M580_9ASTR|nr:unnamed protein product [Lactuca virosa]